MNDKVQSHIKKTVDDPDTNIKVQIAHQIMHFFQYKHKGMWVNEKELMKKDRLYEQVFNDLVKKGFILKKKKDVMYQYKWNVAYPTAN